MRTTLNLDEDVARRLAELARRSGRSLSRVANDLLRAGLREFQRRPRAGPYEPPVLETGAPLLDVTDVAQALDVLDG
ncbi:MAG TPA: CopG family transcriptional regulator [Actinomycetota bacterium]|nr:CopG family transcriptional regulator [Actinomycetota bacterium]